MQNLDRNQKTILITFVVMLLALPFLILGVKYAQDLRSSASENAKPQDIFFSNITSNSVTVSYKTADAVTGSATASGAGGVLSGTDSRDTSNPGKYKIHHIVIPNLKPTTEYKITVFSGGANTDAGKVKTSALQQNIGTPDPLYGKISGNITEAIVYAVAGNKSGGNSTVASEVITNSTFVIDRNTFIGKDGKPVDKTKNDVLIFVDALEQGKAKVQVAGDKNPDTINLSKSMTAKFNPKEVIVVGEQPDPNPDSTPESNPEPDPDQYTLDEFSESLLTDLYTTGAEKTNAYAPYNIFISNVNPTGFTVNWLTKQPSIGYIEVIEGNQNNKVVDPRDGSIDNAKKRFTHSVEAKSGSIPAGTIFKFNIVSNGIKFGKNVQETSEHYNKQYKAYAAKYYPENQNEQTQQTQQTTQATGTAQTAEAIDIPVFVYDPDSDLGQYAPATIDGSPVDPGEGIKTEPLRVIIPSAPDSPPAPKVQQGSVKTTITSEKYADALKVLGKHNTEVESTAIDTERDTLVAAKTGDGVWSTALPTTTNGFSLSMGSSLTEDKTKYVDLTSSTSMTVNAYGPLNQQSSASENFSDTNSISIELKPTQSFLSILHGNVISEPLVYGYAAEGGSLKMVVNGTEEVVQVKTDSSWQSLTKNLKAGFNEITITDETNNETQTVYFIVDLSELPVTGIGLNEIFIILGIILLVIGIISYRKYNVLRR